jgi:hypothetical protein
MNIIALSLGLTPVPPRPAAAVGRLHYTPHERDARDWLQELERQGVFIRGSREAARGGAWRSV